MPSRSNPPADPRNTPRSYMARLRLDEHELESRRRFFEIDDDDLRRLAALRPLAERHTEAIVEEFTGTENAEIHLSCTLADRQVEPAIDVVRSGTRRDDLLLDAQELAIVTKVRRALAGLAEQEAVEWLVQRLQESPTNAEFLLKMQDLPDAKA